MDKSFLSQPAVVAASRNFVCIRLTSYEDPTEMAFCRSLFIGRSGDAENTTFTILSPDGKQPLVRTGRSTQQVWANAAAMAAGMNKIASEYPTAPTTSQSPLPITLDARLGLDVAASDNLRLVVVVASNPVARNELEAKVAASAWTKELLGRYTYATASQIADIPALQAATISEGVLVIEPDAFGQKGKVIAQLPGGASAEQLAKLLRENTSGQRAAKNMQQHRAEGIRQGAFWEPKLPVTDREENNARARSKKAMDKSKP
jgi:hypothetical protein